MTGQIIKPEKYKTDTPDAYFTKDKAQPLSTIFFCGGLVENAAIVVAGVRGVSAIYEDETATALRADKQRIYSFSVATDNSKRHIVCSYLDRKQADMDRYTLLIMIDNYWFK